MNSIAYKLTCTKCTNRFTGRVYTNHLTIDYNTGLAKCMNCEQIVDPSIHSLIRCSGMQDCAQCYCDYE